MLIYTQVMIYQIEVILNMKMKRLYKKVNLIHNFIQKHYNQYLKND